MHIIDKNFLFSKSRHFQYLEITPPHIACRWMPASGKFFRIKCIGNVDERPYGVVHVVIPESAGTAAGKNIFHPLRFCFAEIPFSLSICLRNSLFIWILSFSRSFSWKYLSLNPVYLSFAKSSIFFWFFYWFCRHGYYAISMNYCF